MQYTPQPKQSQRIEKTGNIPKHIPSGNEKGNTNLGKQSTILESNKIMFPMNLDVNPKQISQLSFILHQKDSKDHTELLFLLMEKKNR
jgi:hypothetical protein